MWHFNSFKHYSNVEKPKFPTNTYNICDAESVATGVLTAPIGPTTAMLAADWSGPHTAELLMLCRGSILLVDEERQTGREKYHSVVASDFTKENISGKYFPFTATFYGLNQVTTKGLFHQSLRKSVSCFHIVLNRESSTVLTDAMLRSRVFVLVWDQKTWPNPVLFHINLQLYVCLML